MVDEVTLEDIFEISEQLLEGGANPGAVACARGVMESVYDRHHIIPRVVPVWHGGEFSFLLLDYLIEGYYYAVMHISAPSRYQQITGWSDIGGRLESGEKFFDPSEFWFKDLDAYLERVNRRRRPHNRP